MKDTVFNSRMEVVFHDEPQVVRRRLQHKYPDDWDRVCIGESKSIVTIPEYLFHEKYETVLQMIRDSVEKRYTPMFKRKPEKYDAFLQRLVHRIFEEVLKP